MKIILIIIGVILLVSLTGFIVIWVLEYDLREATISEVDLGKIADGVYAGQYHKGRWKNKVEVTIKDGRIVDIKNINELPDAWAVGIVEEAIVAVIENQSVKIDAISGASLNAKLSRRQLQML